MVQDLTSNSEKSSFVNCNTAETFSYTAESTKNVMVSYNNDLIGDLNSVYTDYKRQSKKPPKQVIYNVLNYGIDTTETQDVSEVVQNVIDIAADSGGGIVYLPSYDYLLENPITVKSGVELRGSADRPHFGTAVNTTFVTDYGKNDANGTALITLESNSGIRGITVDYAKTKPDGTPYAYTIRGNGENIYVVNCTVDSAWQVADFMTNRCDNHYIEAVNFGTLKTGIAVGGGSVGGVVRDCQSNPTANRDSRNTIKSVWWDGEINKGTDLSLKWTLENVTGYIVDDATNELHFMNFIYGCSTGISITGDATITSIGHGTDQAYYGIYVADTSDAKIISTELPVRMGTKSYSVYLADGYTGKTDVISAEVWAVGENAFYCGDGELSVCGSIISQGGKDAVCLKKGKAKIMSTMITRLNLNNYKVLKNVESLELHGNITLTNNKAMVHTSAKIIGSDVGSLAVSTVSTESKNTISFWDDTLRNYSNASTPWDYRLVSGKVGTDDDGGYLYLGLDNYKVVTISFYKKESLDISNMRYLEFDFYISDTSLFDKSTEMQLELSSSTNIDVDEIGYGMGCFKNGMLKPGWNHIKLDLERYNSVLGNFDSSAVKRIRMYYVLSDQLSGEIRIKNIEFSPSDYPENPVYFNNYSSASGWGATKKVSCHSSNDAYYRLGEPITYVRAGVDISEMDYFCFDLYVSDADLFNNTTSGSIELTSSEIWDIAEATYGLSYFKGTLSTGWNRVTIPISAFYRNSTTDKAFDLENVNFFRIYTNVSQLGIAVGNLHFGTY